MYKPKFPNKVQKIKRTDIFSNKKRSEIMSLVKSKNSKIEQKVGKILWSQRFRYRKNVTSLVGKPDFSNKKRKTVVFVDSCFWHGCGVHGARPKTNRVFWSKKIEANIKRDQMVTRFYKKESWKILRIWEHNLRNQRSSMRISRKLRNAIRT